MSHPCRFKGIWTRQTSSDVNLSKTWFWCQVFIHSYILKYTVLSYLIYTTYSNSTIASFVWRIINRQYLQFIFFFIVPPIVICLYFLTPFSVWLGKRQELAITIIPTLLADTFSYQRWWTFSFLNSWFLEIIRLLGLLWRKEKQI